MNHETIDGVPVLFAQRPGQTAVNLSFRVGQADEKLTERGITHLIEHLALFPLGIRDHHANGQTGLSITNFQAGGDARDVVTFLDQVTRALSALPLERLEAERSVLRTEASQRPSWVAAEIALWRYGALGDGAAAHPEMGLDLVDETAVEAWRDHWFTADNAVLVVVGPELPTGLRLHLPAGVRRAVPPARSLLPNGRSTLSAGSNRVLFDALVERSTEATILARLVDQMMFQRLRLDSGYSYVANCGYEPRDGTTAIIAGLADALEDKSDVLVGSMVDLLAELRLGRFPDEAVEKIVTGRLEDMENPDNEADFRVGMTMSNSFDLLVGGTPLSGEQVVEQLRSLSPDQVRQLSHQVFSDLLLQVPAGHSADWGGFVPVADWTGARLPEAQVYALYDGGSIECSPQGVSAVSERGAITVLYQACAACLSWPDGGRLLIGEDGFVVRVEPTLIRNGSAAVSAVDAAMDPARVIPQAARAPEEIPQPEQADPGARKRLGWLRRRRDL